ncbi:MAG: hypothetical protein K1Y02_17365 [Candidatus Hydrogenedentes bacterium]|nr:hypothetical protein [Candidatus Hydrogenedentota bacterium]
MNVKRQCAVAFAAIAISAIACTSGCATKSEAKNEARDEKTSPGNPKVVFEPNSSVLPEPGAPSATNTPAPRDPFKQPRVTIKLPATTLGVAVRQIGETAKPSLVLMNGVENKAIAARSFRNESLDKVAASFAEETILKVQRCPNYVFLYPPGYESLEAVSVSGKLGPTFDIGIQGMAFGSGLRLYTVFSWISLALNVSIVADDAIADARCGELVLGNVPLPDALEAILKSARVVKYSVESTGEYVFVFTQENTSAPSQLLNEDALSEAQKAFLEKRINVFLPHQPEEGQTVEMALGPKTLGDILPSLSKQLSITVVAEKGLEGLPVNPAVFRGVRVKTALDLMIRQWLEPNYGYQLVQDRIVIRKR